MYRETGLSVNYIIKIVFIELYSLGHKRLNTAWFWYTRALSINRFLCNCLLKIFLIISFIYLMPVSHSETEFETILITTVEWDGILNIVAYSYRRKEKFFLFFLVRPFFKQVNFANKKANLRSFLPSSPESTLYKLVFFLQWFCFS